MRTSFLTAILTFLLSTLTLAIPSGFTTLTSDPPFQVSNLTFTKDTNTTNGGYCLTFNVRDPSHFGNGTAFCNATWALGSKGYPQGSYALCGNTTFGWNMQSYTNIHKFQLGLEHTFIDPKVGQAPYNVETNFAIGNITRATTVCTTQGTLTSCAQRAGGIVQAPIYATIAKRR